MTTFGELVPALGTLDGRCKKSRKTHKSGKSHKSHKSKSKSRKRSRCW
jgi:hypothetical protein